jgi:hypothetical protein
MAELNTTIASTGSALVGFATLTLGPLLGEYVIIFSLGLIGTLLALSEVKFDSFKESLVFMFKGVVLSLVFTGLMTTFIVSYLPKDLGLTPYALLGTIAFSIGWLSNRTSDIKNWIINILTSFKGGGK